MKPLFVLTLLITLFATLDIAAQKKKPIGKASSDKPTSTGPVIPKSSYSGRCGGDALTAGEIAELVAAHNRARATRKLAPYTWDCRLADMAQEWANKGIFEHRTGVLEGENLFVSSSPTEPVATVITTWLAEKVNWDNKSATCAAGKFCNHYTQVMWRSTTKFGCGISRGGAGKWKALVVCNYSPGQTANVPAYPEE